jgi:hypothetical protein
LFPLIYPYGFTPEGLCFESILNILPTATTDDKFYFLNFSDGKPNLGYRISENADSVYSGEQAALHTKQQIDKIIKSGYMVLSFFIKSENVPSFQKNKLVENDLSHFKIMYGKNSSFIDINDIHKVSKNLNDMFLQKT